ncbi:glycosyl hydrolase family 35 [Ancylostoma ceylanicum]|uniref:Glycosyl hydrolase family 35 n=1 Tax=Ancylostoma ceylanicum TaxID=53326 RepID=A0A0D6LEU9_9BILA|nr:glycosyl hydrolase family 35 [Ancylostoma ceylanicum]
MISRRTWEDMDSPKLDRSTITIRTADGSAINILGSFKAAFTIFDRKGRPTEGKGCCYVTESTDLLGLEWCIQMHDYKELREQYNCKLASAAIENARDDIVNRLKTRFADVFSPGLGRCTKTKARLFLKPGARPVYRQKRPGEGVRAVASILDERPLIGCTLCILSLTLQRVRALGFNAIQYYIPWNFHEVYEGEYDFSGMRNFTEFSRIAYDLGMYTLIRVGPYICAEWENGGLPWWLLKKNISMMRTSEQRFKEEVSKWFSVLLPIVKPMLRQNNGPVLMVQVENEYGSYEGGYTAWLRDLFKSHLGEETVLYTTDGGSNSLLKCGTVPDTLTTVDFGPTAEKKINSSFADQRKYLPNGWIVLWGQKSASLPSPGEVVNSAKYMYNLGANINFYMIHGGTNFGFWNGGETNAPCITSYDYFAPISEAGDVTPKYLGIRSWIKSIPDWKTQPLDVPQNNPLVPIRLLVFSHPLMTDCCRKKAFGNVKMVPVDDLTQPPNRRNCISSPSPMSFEQINQPFGFVLYTRGTFMHSYNGKSRRSVDLDDCNPGDVLTIFVENQGRQTYETINDYKGILSDVELDKNVLHGWTQCKLDIIHDYADTSSSNAQGAGKYGVYHGTFKVDVPTDTFLNTTGWGKGVAVINGNNLGRYWATEGPQVNRYHAVQLNVIKRDFS